jgi:uncharacterized protein
MNFMPRVVSACVGVGLLITAITGQAVAQSQDPPTLPVSPLTVTGPSITVTGTGEVQTRPDIVEIRLGVLTEASTAAEALRRNTEAMDALLETLRERNIERRDIQTAQFNVAPRYHYDRSGERPPQIVAYQVSNQVRVKVRKIDDLGTILDKVVQQGANQIHGINFSVDDPTEFLDEARKKAIDDARRKAKLYAEAAEVQVGRPLLIQERIADPPVPLPFRQMEMQAADRAVPIEAGEHTLRVNVSVTYALESPND